MAKRRTAVLISGRGSNLQALIDQAAQPAAAAEVALVVSNRADALGLARAEAAGIAGLAIDDRRFSDRETFEAELDRVLARTGIEIVCLAGFLRVLTAAFVARWRDRLLNIHPSLLPAFPGFIPTRGRWRRACASTAAQFILCVPKWIGDRYSSKALHQC